MAIIVIETYIAHCARLIESQTIRCCIILILFDSLELCVMSDLSTVFILYEMLCIHWHIRLCSLQCFVFILFLAQNNSIACEMNNHAAFDWFSIIFRWYCHLFYIYDKFLEKCFSLTFHFSSLLNFIALPDITPISVSWHLSLFETSKTFFI